MTTTFTGEVRIPGSIENGLPSTITLDAQTLVLTAGGTELGRWNRTDLKLRREADGTFHLTLGREVVLFNPDSPLEFAILSGMPGAGTAPAPAAVEPAAAPPTMAPAPPAAPAIPEPAAPAASAPPIAAVPGASPAPPAVPAAPEVAPTPPAPQPSPSTPPPAAPQPSPATAPPAAPAAAPPAPAAPVAASTPAAAAAPAPIVETPGAPPAAPSPDLLPSPAAAASATAQTAQQPSVSAPSVPAPSIPPEASAAPQAAAAAPPAAAVPGAVEILLESGPADGGEPAPPTAPSAAPPLDPASAFPPEEPQSSEGPPPAEAPRSGQTKDFWDGFYAEEQEVAAILGEPLATAEATAPPAPAEQSTGFQLRDSEEDDGEDEAPSVGGYGSGLFKDDGGDAELPPAFAGDEPPEGDGRSWSYYEDEDGDQDGDRGWSYDDEQAAETDADAADEADAADAADAEEPPAFRSPVADRDELVKSAKTSRFSGIAGWRPSLPSLSLGSSALGMRARDALGILDAILEENGTEDIPKSFIVGLGGFAAVLALVALLVVLFG